MKNNYLLLLIFVFLTTGLFGQDYSETFSTPNKGILSGPCTGTDGTTCLSSDFTGVNWTIEGNLSGIDAEPFATNDANQLVVTDIDEEACWVSPLLNITEATAAFSADLSWLGYDAGGDYINVEYSIDQGTSWTTIPNLIGGGSKTIQYASGTGVDGSTTISVSNIEGATLQIRICIDHNSAQETTTISNILAFGAELAGPELECDLVLNSTLASDETCPGSGDGRIDITATTSNGPITYSISGPQNLTNSTGVFEGLPPGNYGITISDDALPAGTCTKSSEAEIVAGFDLTPPTATAPADTTVVCPSDVPMADIALVTDVSDDCTVPCTNEPWINEFHYDVDGTDFGEFVEIAGPAGLDLSSYAIHTYDGSDRMEDQVISLEGIIDDEQNGFGALSFEIANLQNQTEGLALVKDGNMVLEFLSYEGSFIAVDGPAAGLTSTDVGVEEPADQLAEESISRIGDGNIGAEFSFVDQIATPGSLNGNQSIMPCPENTVTVALMGDSDNGGAGSEADPLIITRTYRITDSAGNADDVQQLITVADTIAPTALCQPALAVSLDSLSGLAFLDAAVFDMGSADNCSMVSLALDRDTLSCEDLGDQILTLLVTDEAGLTASCTTVVAVSGAEEYCAMVPTRDRYNELAHLQVYPNPANQAVAIDLSRLDLTRGTGDLVILNTLGQVVYQQTFVKNTEQVVQLNTTDFAAGVYYIQYRINRTPSAAGRLLIER